MAVPLRAALGTTERHGRLRTTKHSTSKRSRSIIVGIVSPPEEPIGLLVSRTAKTLSRSLDAALAERGGSLPSWLVLTSVIGGMHGSQRSIAAEVGVEGPTLTHHLNRMEAAGLVTRQRDPQQPPDPSGGAAPAVGPRRVPFAPARSCRASTRGSGAGFTDDELTTLASCCTGSRRTRSGAVRAVTIPRRTR